MTDSPDTGQDNPVTILISAAVAGIITGVLCSFLRGAIGYLIQIRQSYLVSDGNSDAGSIVILLSASTLMSVVAAWLVFRLAPEARGSGIPEVEGAIEGLRTVRWWRIMPVKLAGTICTLSAGMVLGVGGPSVQLGASSGQMVHELCRFQDRRSHHMLMVCGTAAGMAAAFNAPLAGILFVVAEEMLPDVHYSFISFKAVIIATITATITCRLLHGNSPLFALPQCHHLPLSALPLVIIMGMICGLVGVVFNHMVVIVRHAFVLFHRDNPGYY
ncbi:chloride channel protein, partial [Endozoicomonas sp. ONNA2]|uniref:chloride channel protein n=1 Tax=Endozoicomonas sp. ONNA2 TaxID=2828741 RepID=UPI0021480182